MKGRSGTEESGNVGMFGAVTNLASADFKVEGGMPFNIKNETDADVTLDVIPASAKDDDFVSTKFYPGWNTEAVKAIRSTPTEVTLKWGY